MPTSETQENTSTPPPVLTLTQMRLEKLLRAEYEEVVEFYTDKGAGMRDTGAIRTLLSRLRKRMKLEGKPYIDFVVKQHVEFVEEENRDRVQMWKTRSLRTELSNNYHKMMEQMKLKG